MWIEEQIAFMETLLELLDEALMPMVVRDHKIFVERIWEIRENIRLCAETEKNKLELT